MFGCCVVVCVCVCVFVVCVLLRVVGMGCVLCGGLRRLPALKTSFVVCSCFMVVARISDFGCLERGKSEEVVCVSCSMGRFFIVLGVFVSVVRLVGLFSDCLSFVVSFFGIGMLCGVWL